MLSNNQEPTFNLKVVVQETGLKPDTLRAWERRYGLPQPHRTPGGHRLYSQEDIDTLKWLVARQREGMSISRAIDLWHQLEAEGKRPLDVGSSVSSVPSLQPSSPMVKQALSDFRQAWISACLVFDEFEAKQILAEAFALYSSEMVCLELLLPGLAEVGQGWFEGKITVHQEHFASGLATRRVEMLLSAAPNPTKSGRILIGCPTLEEHVFAPLLLNLLLRRRGWDVVYLGANVPLIRLETTIATTRPNLVILAAQQLPSTAHLQEMALLLHKLKILIAFGGRVFNIIPTLQQAISGHFLGEIIEDAVDVVEQLMTNPTPNPTPVTIPEPYKQTLSAYQRYLAHIEADVSQVIYSSENLHQHFHLNSANQNLAQHIIAALALGNIDYIRNDLAWIKGLLDNQQMSTDVLIVYLTAYQQAIQTHLGESGQPLQGWFEQLLL